MAPAARSNPAVKAVLRASFPAFKGRRVEVQQWTKPVWVTAHWDEGTKDDVVILDPARGIGRMETVGAPWTNPHGTLAQVEQPVGSIMVVLHHFANLQSVTIVVRPNPALPVPALMAGLVA